MDERTPPLAKLCAVALLWAAQAAAAPTLSIEPGTAHPGDVVLIRVDGAKSPPSGTLGKRPLAFYAYQDHHEALAPLPVESTAGPLPLSLTADDAAGPHALQGSIDVLPPAFPTRELTVAGKFIEPPAGVKKQIADDKEAFAKAFAQPLAPRLFDGNFAWPRPPVFNAHFGDQRTFNGHLESQHYGADLAGKTGDRVTASNVGVVVLARQCYSSGGTVLLYHGGNAYSAYFHLSRIDVKVGEKLARGAPLGRVGKSGRVTGPHLHFGMKVDGLYVDPESMFRLAFP